MTISFSNNILHHGVSILDMQKVR